MTFTVQDVCINCGAVCKVDSDEYDDWIGTCSVNCSIDSSDDCMHGRSSKYCVKCHPVKQLELDLGV